MPVREKAKTKKTGLLRDRDTEPNASDLQTEPDLTVNRSPQGPRARVSAVLPTTLRQYARFLHAEKGNER
ncbi:hypothetical protein CSOJ01_10069 [Colletotrichum sojae]|uniref:Uncharacterized protein n=1 Tax=Colletotrichum sojae TaxID=2175907 RepID=A0A8H6J157_9PEZI|nr:hypothetical protein CSOJ01_10069 [Colletotrichum sojae]